LKQAFPDDAATSAGAMAPSGAGHGLKYRRDIDGLRAIAVISVVLFHLGSSVASGGYAGVDIFFVISGYLITGAIHRDIVDRNFTITGFYERRIRRIFPALLATMAFTYVAALVIFMPDELRDLGGSMLATAAFCSNILFWMQADYFAGPVEFKPLLHTWSLAVEEQFYIVVPALMVLIHRRAPRHVAGVLAALTILSFAASCAYVWIDPSGNYYLPYTRAWELLFGSLVALGVLPRIRDGRLSEAVAMGGLAMMVAPLFLLTSESVFPAWNAVPTCLGAALLISTGGAGGEATLANRMLGTAPLVRIGLISYSFYLVHWPIIVFVKYYLMREPTAVETAAMAAAMLLAAWLSWRFVEQPFRNRRRFSRRAILAGGLALSGAVGALGLATFALDGFPQRFGARATLAVRDTAQQHQQARCFLRNGWQEWQGENCFLTRGPGPVILLWGDSHANHFAPVLKEQAGKYQSNILFYGSAGCPPILDVDIAKRPDCRANNSHALEIIRQYGVTRVVLSSYWQRIFDDNGLRPEQFEASVRRLQAMGVDVRVIGDNPDFPFANPAYLGVRLAGREDADAPFYTGVRNDFGFNAKLARALPPGHFFDPMPLLCRGHECLAYEKGKLLMSDNAHLSRYGAAKLLAAADSFFR
jgi:peptidoglycan/LPS O-acetylase OafA/YrhL